MSQENFRFEMEWYAVNAILPVHKNLFIAQASCWVICADKKIILVSKDNKKWTIPAGHTEKSDVDYFDTAIREVAEETGLDISKKKNDLRVLGYYVIKALDKEKGTLENEDIQIRLLLTLDVDSDSLNLEPNEKDSQIEKVKYAMPFTLDEAISKVPWLSKAGDLAEVRKIVNFK